MERFTVWLLAKLIRTVLLLASLGVLSQATIHLQRKTYQQLRTNILSLQQVQRQLQNR